MSHQLLPTAMSMDDVLREEESARALAEAEEVSEHSQTAPRRVVNQPIAGELEPVSDRKWIWVVAVLLAVGGGGAVAFLMSDRSAETTVAEKAETPSAPPQEPPAETAPVPAKADDGLPTDLESLRALPFRERHRRLETAKGDVPVELHVALDLVQADQAENPCRTFADALSTIEASDNREPFSWAVDEAEAPSGSDPVCSSLAERLEALRQPSAAAAAAPTKREAPAPARPKRPRPKPTPKPKKPTPTPTAAPPAEPEKPAPKPREHSVATKLDDDELRGLGE